MNINESKQQQKNNKQKNIVETHAIIMYVLDYPFDVTRCSLQKSVTAVHLSLLYAQQSQLYICAKLEMI